MKKTEKNKKRFKVFLFVVIFTIGLSIALFPVLSQWYYRTSSVKQMEEFDLEASAVKAEVIRQKIELAKEYNSTLRPEMLSDTFTKRQKDGIAEYARMLEIKERLGYIEIPSIDQKLPIFAGTSDDVLSSGAGHLEGTSLPIGGTGTHTVITAHTGLPTARLFTDINKLKKDDVFYIRNIEGTLAYKVDRILTVEPHDFTPVLVDKQSDYCTLLTCTPYMINSHRLLVRGHRIPFEDKAYKQDITLSKNKKNRKQIMILTIFVFTITGILAAVIILFYKKKDDELQKDLKVILKDEKNKKE